MPMGAKAGWAARSRSRPAIICASALSYACIANDLRPLSDTLSRADFAGAVLRPDVALRAPRRRVATTFLLLVTFRLNRAPVFRIVLSETLTHHPVAVHPSTILIRCDFLTHFFFAPHPASC